MKVILYMAMSLNGMIARKNDDTSFISKEEWDSYSKIVRKAGNLVIGHRTYDILTKQPEFKEFEKVKVIIVSKKKFRTLSSNHSIAKSPKESLESLGGFNDVIVAGGSILNASFMKENLVDEIYIDVEPTILGKGIRLFAEADFEAELKLFGTKKISKDGIQLHYKVVR